MSFRSWMVGIATVVTMNSLVSIAWSADSVYLKSSHGVNPIGAFTQNIPIEIPPGTAGMQPSLSLSYNSQMTNGLVGKGWSISGLSAITRCPATVAQDTYTGGVTLASTDRFCLDGMKLLAVSGTYGADSTEYRTETESFKRVFSYGTTGSGPSYFMVMAPSGQTMYYGNTTDSKLVAQSNSTIIIWALNQVRDLESNYYNITYTNDSTNGQYYPAEIDYTGNTSASVSPYNSVKFSYATRPDNAAIYRSDAMMKTLVRLTDVKTYANGSEVLDYQLGYNLSGQSGSSLLTSVTPISAPSPSMSLLPVSLGWNTPNGSYTSSVGVPAQIPGSATNLSATYTAGAGAGNSGSGIYNLGAGQLPPLAGDFNGDGITDFVQLVQGTSMSSVPVCFGNQGGSGFSCTNYALSTAFSSSSTAQFLIGDFDGDGLSDIAQVDPTTSTMTVCYSQGNGQFTCQSKSMPGITSGQFITADLNGDGMTDIIEVGVYGNNTVETCISGGRGVANTCTSTTPTNFTNNSSIYATTHFYSGDYDGDGLGDFLEITDGETGAGLATVCYSNGDGTFSCSATSISLPFGLADAEQSDWFVGDFNGDGITDVAMFSGLAGGLYTCNFIGRGVQPTCSTAAATVPSIASDGSEVYYAVSSPIAIADLNGDGRSDIISPISLDGVVTWQLCYSGSDGSLNCTVISPPPISLLSGSAIAPGNFTGNGTASILSVNPSYSYVSLNSTVPIYPDLLTSVTNGLGATTSITYAPLSNSSVYQKGSGSVYPTQDIQNSAYVVSVLQEPDGLGGTHSITYDYTGAKMDLQGRGFLGFATITQQDLQYSREVQTNYNQSYPLIGYPSSTASSIYQGSSWNLSGEKSYTYGYTNLGGTRDFVYLGTEVDSLYDFVHNALASTATTVNAYDSYGNLTSATMTTSDSYQKVTTNIWANVLGGPGSIWYLGQLSSSQQANTNPDLTSATRTTQYTYSSTYPNELLTEQLQPGGTDYLTKTYAYDSFGNRNSVAVTGSGMSSRTTTITYDSLGQFPITTVNPLSQTETRAFDARFGIVNSFTDVNGLTTTWTIDALGRKVNETRPDSTQTNVTLSVCTSSCGMQTYNIQATNSGQPTVTIYYDILDREYQRSMAGFNSSTIWRNKSYDAMGRLSATSRNFFIGGSPVYTYNTYDKADRMTSQYDPDGGTTQWSYNNLTTTITNPRNQTRVETKDSLGQLIQVTDAAGQISQYKFDPFGNLETSTDPQGHQIIVTYDVLGRKKQVNDPDLGIWNYTYDGAGDQLTQTDAKNQTQTMTYDLLGRLLTKQTTEFTSTWTYDSATNGVGKLASVTNASGFTKAYAYDSYGRPSSEQTTADTTYTISTAYDSYSHINQITYPTGFAVSYQYDSSGYLKELDNASTSAMLWQRNSQNADNLSLQDTFGNGVVSASTYYATTGRLQSLVATSGSTSLQSLSVSYDTLGNTTQRTDLINQYTGATLTDAYTYDNLNRLTGDVNSRETDNFSYDVLGNLISKTNVGDMKYGDGRPSLGRPLHAVMSTNGPVQTTFSYDANGNMTGGEGRTLSWTSFNKPSSISNASNTLTFSYDPNLERYKEVESTCQDYHGNSSTTCVKYLINPRQDIGVHFEKETNGSITSYRNFLYAGGGNVVGVYTTRSDGSSSTNYFHKDHLGSVVLSTTDNGAVVERLSYDAFGKRRNVIGTDDPSDILRSMASHQGFTGQEMLDDGGLGLVDMNGRVYDPLIGRFTSADPYIQATTNLQNLNRYSYVINNPTSLIDPSGYWFGNDIVNAISSVGNWIGNNAETIALVTVVVVASVLTAGAVDAALLGAGATAGLGTAIIAGAAAGAVAGGLSSTLLGGGFSWQAVGLGALAGGVGGGVSSALGGLGGSAGASSSVGAAAGQVGVSALAGGTATWAVSAVTGHAGINSFFQGAEIGAISAAALIGGSYLTSSSVGAGSQSSYQVASSDQTATDGNNSLFANVNNNPGGFAFNLNANVMYPGMGAVLGAAVFGIVGGALFGPPGAYWGIGLGLAAGGYTGFKLSSSQINGTQFNGTVQTGQ